jgi:threonine aldolase
MEEMPKRLAEDHANARMLGERLAELPEVEIDLASVQTNIVIFSLRKGDANSLLARLRARGLILGTMGPTGIRLVTHHDVTRADCERAGEILIEEIRKS